MQISTARLVLGPPQDGDVAPLYHSLVGSRVTDTLAWDGPSCQEDLAGQLLEIRRSHRLHPETFVMRLRESNAQGESGAPVGMISLRRVVGSGRGVLSYWLDEQYHGLGLMTEAVDGLLRWGFVHLNLDEMFAQVFVGNYASRRVLEKCGLSLHATVPCAGQKRGVWVDKWQFRATQDDWFSLHSDDYQPILLPLSDSPLVALAATG